MAYSYSSEQSGLYILCHNVFWMPDKLLPSVRKKCENMGLGSGLYVLVVTWWWSRRLNLRSGQESESLNILFEEGRMS